MKTGLNGYENMMHVLLRVHSAKKILTFQIWVSVL